MSKKKILFSVVLIILLLLVGFLFWRSKSLNLSDFRAYELLLQAFPGFDQGTQLLKETRYDEATPLFDGILSGRNLDIEKEANVKYALALSLSSLPARNFDDLTRSIDLFKEIVADPNYPEILKAQSVLAMDQLLFSPATQKARELITSTEPYKSLDNGDSLANFEIKLLRYGESFYPIPGIEMRLAVLHAKRLADMAQKKEEGSNAINLNIQMEPEKTAVIEAIHKGDASMYILEEKPYLFVHIPSVLMHKAIAVQYFSQATGEKTFGEPEVLFQQALASAETHYPFQSTYVRYYYAVFLANQTERRVEDIKGLLSEFHGTPTTPGALYLTYIFRREIDNIVGEKANLIMLSEIDPQFREYLISLRPK